VKRRQVREAERIKELKKVHLSEEDRGGKASWKRRKTDKKIVGEYTTSKVCSNKEKSWVCVKVGGDRIEGMKIGEKALGEAEVTLQRI